MHIISLKKVFIANHLIVGVLAMLGTRALVFRLLRQVVGPCKLVEQLQQEQVVEAVRNIEDVEKRKLLEDKSD